MNTTRKHPRTMNEAFPFGPEYGCAITKYGSDGHRWILPVCFFAAFCLFLVIAMENFA